jgi:site-specific DNA-methyltransferase (adenine-specific)
VTPFFTSDRGSIYKAYAQDVYPLITPGSVSLVISDGPYNMRKAEWDKFAGWDAFVDWYRPHIAAWGVACAPSATVYVWGSDESEGYLRAPMRAAGWTFRGSIVWDKGQSPAQIGGAGLTSWIDATERCGVWTRGKPPFNGCSASLTVWPVGYPTSAERLRSDVYVQRVAGRPPERVALHPCQKPLALSERIIRASSRPGELVLEPFGGTCRAAVACERLPAAEARRYVCIEPDEDGRDYLPAILPQLRYDPADDEVGLQRGLFQ